MLILAVRAGRFCRALVNTLLKMQRSHKLVGRAVSVDRIVRVFWPVFHHKGALHTANLAVRFSRYFLRADS